MHPSGFQAPISFAIRAGLCRSNRVTIHPRSRAAWLTPSSFRRADVVAVDWK